MILRLFSARVVLSPNKVHREGCVYSRTREGNRPVGLGQVVPESAGTRRSFFAHQRRSRWYRRALRLNCAFRDEPKHFSRRAAEAAEDPGGAEIRRVLGDRSFSGSARRPLPASPRKIRFSLRALPACARHLSASRTRQAGADRRLCVSNCNTWDESSRGETVAR